MKTGSDGTEKDKFIWYDQLHEILSGKPVVDPVDLVESSPDPVNVSVVPSAMDDNTDDPANVTTDINVEGEFLFCLLTYTMKCL